MILTRKEAQAVVYDDSEDWEYISGTREIIDNSRWSIYERAVYLHIPSGKHYQFYWSHGATEMQDESPFEYEDKYEPVEVHLVEKTVKVWENIK